VVHDCKRIVLPRRARNATLQVLHRSKAGVAKTAEAARQLYFWPKMNEHIKDMIDACERCQFYKSSKQKQEQIQQTPFKDLYPMVEVGADLFEAGKHHFLIFCDRYSGFPLVARLNSMTEESIIGHMEKMFFCYWAVRVKSNATTGHASEHNSRIEQRKKTSPSTTPPQTSPRATGWQNAPSASSSTCC
jgi:hypothetical protein